MHWFEHLSSLYCESDIPLFHAIINTDIEVRIDIAGRFLGAELRKERVLVPVTEHSVCRTSGIEPHPLSDKLCYLTAECGDRKKYNAYMEQLNDWAASDASTQRLRAVRQYLFRSRIHEDVFGNDSPICGELVVRFIVDGVKLWQDKELQESYISYYRNVAVLRDTCCVTGEFTAVASVHQKRITSDRSAAKLISFRHRDRIVDERTGCSPYSYPVGMECSFKAHTVLRRLIAGGGVVIGGKTFLAWDDEGNTITLPLTENKHFIKPIGGVTIMVFTELSKGRLTISMNRRLTSTEFMDSLRLWQEIGMGMIRITQLGFGRLHNGEFICVAGILENTVQRMLECMICDRKIPEDIILAVKRHGYQTDKLQHYNDTIERRMTDAAYLH